MSSKNNKSLASALSVVLFLVCPALAILSIVMQAYSGKYKNLTILALSISLVALFTPPFADIYRHTLLYFGYESLSDTIIQSNGHDFIFYTLANLNARNGIPFEYVSFVFVFTCYQISFYLFKELLKSDKIQQLSRKKIFNIFLCFLLMVPFIAIINGLRMATAAYIALFAWYMVYKQRCFFGSFLFVIALCTHFGAWLFLPLILFSSFKNIKIHKSVFIIVSVSLLLAGGILLQLLPQSFLEMVELTDKVSGYMENNEERFDETMSINGRIAMYLERLPLIAVMLLILWRRVRLDDRDMSIVYVAIWLSLLYHPFIVLFQRYGFFVVPVLIFLCMQGQINQPNTNRTAKVLMLSCVIMTFSYIYGYRATFFNTKYYKMFYPSFVTIPTTDTHELFKDALIPK